MRPLNDMERITQDLYRIKTEVKGLAACDCGDKPAFNSLYEAKQITLKGIYASAINSLQAAIGQPFKVIALRGGILGDFDTIRSVSADGYITGDYTEAHCEDCRIKEPEAAHLAEYRLSKKLGE